MSMNSPSVTVRVKTLTAIWIVRSDVPVVNRLPELVHLCDLALYYSQEHAVVPTHVLILFYICHVVCVMQKYVSALCSLISRS